MHVFARPFQVLSRCCLHTARGKEQFEPPSMEIDAFYQHRVFEVPCLAAFEASNINANPGLRGL